MRWFRRLRNIRWVLAIACLLQGVTAVHALQPFPGGMNNLMAQTMESRGLRMGLSAADPRIAGTLEGMGDAAAGFGTDVAVGAAAGTAITWGAVALGAVVVGAGIWYLASDHKYSVQCDSITSCALALLSGSGHPTLSTGGVYWTSQAISGTTNVCSEGAACVETDLDQLNAASSSYVYSVNGTATSTASTYTQPAKRCDSKGANCATSYSYTASKHTGTYTGPTCASGAASYSGSDATTAKCFDLVAAAVKSNPLALPDAIPGSELGKPADPALMAQVANRLWQRAANTTGYSGLPYTSDDPITAADMQQIQTSRPDLWPTVGDLDAPVEQNAQTGTALTTVPLPANGSKTSSDPGYVSQPSTGTNPAQSQPLDNLGPDPGTAAPDVTSETQTATSILDPVFNFLPTIGSTALTVPTGATCPTYDGTVYTWNLHIDAHCTLIENNRAIISAAMILGWTIMAALILLRA